MRKFLLPFFGAAALFLSASVHAVPCPGESEGPVPFPPTGTICGVVKWIRFNGISLSAKPAQDMMNVKICPAGATNGCTTVTTSGFWHAGSKETWQTYKFPNYRFGMDQYADFDLYAWSDSTYWGSSVKPIERISVNKLGQIGLSLWTYPSPLPPTPVYPSGTWVPNSYLVRWQSGIDLDRLPYPATYEVWYKYWPFGATEPAIFTLARANMPCQDDGSGPDDYGECSTFVSGPQPSGNWKWHVVANLELDYIWDFPGTVFTTKSTALGFTQPF